MKLPPVVSEQEWRAALEEIRVKEKAATRARDALAAERRRLPRVRLEKDWVFDGRDGRCARVRRGPSHLDRPPSRGTGSGCRPQRRARARRDGRRPAPLLPPQGLRDAGRPAKIPPFHVPL